MKHIIKKQVIIPLLIVAFLLSTAIVFAANDINVDNLLYKFQMTDNSGAATTTDYIASLPEGTATDVIGDLVKFMLIVANILAFLSFVVAGLFMIMAQGNDEDLGKAKKIFMYTILAMVICATTLAIVTGITKFNFF